MEGCLGKTMAMDVEANPVQVESEVMREEDPKEKAAVKTVRSLAWGPASSCKALQSAKEMDPGQWQVAKKVGCCPQRDHLTCCARVAQR